LKSKHNDAPEKDKVKLERKIKAKQEELKQNLAEQLEKLEEIAEKITAELESS
jgi:hypothetical protein